MKIKSANKGYFKVFEIVVLQMFLKSIF